MIPLSLFVQRLTVICLSLALGGCADLPAMIREAAKDHASVHIEVNTIYGRIVYDRSNPKSTPVAHIQ